jgi:hypothetical protein
MDRIEFLIYGVGNPENPNIRVINSASNECDGLYKYKTRGSSGDIYVNEGKNKAIKINHQPQEEEVKKQLSVEDLAPTIYENASSYTVYMEGTENIANTDSPYENIGVIIMEYLNPVDWTAINAININDKQIMTLLDALYKLLFTYKLINLMDMIGYSGPHIFIKKEEPYEVKFIDYDNYEIYEGGSDKACFEEICTTLSKIIKPSARFLFNLHDYILRKWHTKPAKPTKPTKRSDRTRSKINKSRASIKKKRKSEKKKKSKKKKTKRKKKRKSKQRRKKSKMR